MPFPGPLREEWQIFLCGHAAAPGALHCDRDATWHGFTVDDRTARITAMMESCDEHLPYMKLSADYVHPLQHPCGIPGSKFRWPENECYTEWDETEFAGLAEVPEMAAT